MGDLTAWTGVIAALFAFLLGHLLPLRPPIRARLVAGIGEKGFLLLYSLQSLLLLVWLVITIRAAPVVSLWYYRPWQSWIPLLCMPVSCILFTCAIAAPNPLSFGGRDAESFDPDRPGIVGFFRHPLLAALAIWSFAHIAPNGELATVLFFGSMGVFSVVGMFSVDRKRRERLGLSAWQRLARNTALIPRYRALRRASPARLPVVRVAAGLLLFVALAGLHGSVIGVPALPALRG